MLRRVRLLAPAVVVLGLVLSHGVRADAPAVVGGKQSTGAAPVPDAPAGPPATVQVGLYLQNIPDIDIKTNSFSAEFYLWFVWAGDLDPTLTYELANVVNPSELVKTPIFVDASGASAPELLPDGRHLQQFHVYGRFGQPFHIARYPFDSHNITIALEDGRSSSERLLYDLDHKGTAMRPDLSIPGWDLSPMKATERRTRFASNFGDPRTGRDDESYSHVDFAMHIERPMVGIFTKTIVPIALIILITFGAFFCKPSDLDARLSLTVTALISAVALQFTAASELPPTGSLLLLDEIYLASYFAILAVTFFSIGVNRLLHAERAQAAERVDRWGFWLVGLGYFGGLALLVLVA
jgi:hypothetical protein